MIDFNCMSIYFLMQTDRKIKFIILGLVIGYFVYLFHGIWTFVVYLVVKPLLNSSDIIQHLSVDSKGVHPFLKDISLKGNVMALTGVRTRFEVATKHFSYYAKGTSILCSFFIFLKMSLHTFIWYQLFLSKTNNLYTVM